MNPEYEKIGIIPLNISLRDEIGCSLNLDEFDKLESVIIEMLSNKKQYYEQIGTYVNDNVFNIGTSHIVGARYIIDSIKNKIERKREINYEKDS
jgi:YidC/Oxa1 family membrane protein insertase